MLQSISYNPYPLGINFMSKREKFYVVYLPCSYSEVWEVKAESMQEAIKKVKSYNGEANCLGEITTGKEDKGIRVEEK